MYKIKQVFNVPYTVLLYILIVCLSIQNIPWLSWVFMNENPPNAILVRLNAVIVVSQKGHRLINTIVIFEKNGDGEWADLVLSAGSESWVDSADDTQRFHDKGEHLGAELSGQLHQALEDTGQERLKDVSAV